MRKMGEQEKHGDEQAKPDVEAQVGLTMNGNIIYTSTSSVVFHSDLKSWVALLERQRAHVLSRARDVAATGAEEHSDIVAVGSSSTSASSGPPSGYAVRLLLPEHIASDYLANMEEIYHEMWVPRYGEKRAKLIWFRNCGGMAIRYWFDTLMAAAQKLRKVIW